jgi:hypothetical protein
VGILSSQLFESNIQDATVQLVRRRLQGLQQALAQAYSRTFANATGSDEAQLTKYLANIELCFKEDKTDLQLESTEQIVHDTKG